MFRVAVVLTLTIAITLGVVSIAWAQGGDRSVIPAFQAASAPSIDGVIDAGEWDAAGPPIVATADNSVFEDNIAADVFGGDDDLSYQFRVMWVEPWTAYFLVEIHDDVAMDPTSTNGWERDQVELFIDGDHLEGTDELDTFHWWAGTEPYGKLSVSRENDFDGHTAIMTDDADELFVDDFGYVAAAGVAAETGPNANFLVEYAVSLEPMWFLGKFEGTPTGDAGKIVANETTIKLQVGVSDDDNFQEGDTERSHYIYYYRDDPGADWRDSSVFADLTFMGPSGGSPALLAGDADMDLDFDQLDLIQVQIAAKYLSGQPATWGEGDWNGAPGGQVGEPPAGNGFFDQLDIIAALAPGHYLTGSYAASRSEDQGGVGNVDPLYVPVPEPSSILLAGIAIVGLLVRGFTRFRGDTAPSGLARR